MIHKEHLRFFFKIYICCTFSGCELGGALFISLLVVPLWSVTSAMLGVGEVSSRGEVRLGRNLV